MPDAPSADRRRAAPILTIGLLLIGWLACYVPWIATKGAALSSNLYDLAEWMSLDPAVRGQNPPLLTTFLLRVVPGLLAVALVNMLPLRDGRALRWPLVGWMIRVLALVIGIGLLPPFDFFRGESGDPNYRQQFILAALTCLGVLIGGWRPMRPIAWIAASLAIIFGALGLFLSLGALRDLGLSVAVGWGAALTLGAALASIIVGVWAARQSDPPVRTN